VLSCFVRLSAVERGKKQDLGSWIQRAAHLLVGVDSLIHRFGADGGMPADLLGAPLFPQPLLGKEPGIIVYTPGIDCTPSHRQEVRLLGAIAASATVSGQFPADGGWTAFQHGSDFALCMSRLLQGVNLVSFFSGEVRVVHLCNFDWQVKRHGCYRIPPT